MKRTALLGALVIAVIACTFAISTPRPAHAALCCDGYGAFGTSIQWEMANSCEEAKQKYLAKVMPEAEAFCDPGLVCATELPPCRYDSATQMYNYDGPMFFDCTYRCTIGPIGPEPI